MSLDKPPVHLTPSTSPEPSASPNRWAIARSRRQSGSTGSHCGQGDHSVWTVRGAGRLWVMAIWALAVSWPGLPAIAGKAHVHGVGQMSVVLEEAQLRVELELPLDTLVGFERSPRTDAEREAARAALARMRTPAALVRPDAAAQCRATGTEVDPSLLEGPARAAPQGHADARVTLLFECGQVGQLGGLDLVLFDAFSRLERLEVQIVTPSGQSKASIRRSVKRLRLPKPGS